MGILNVTPDSFSDGGDFSAEKVSPEWMDDPPRKANTTSIFFVDTKNEKTKLDLVVEMSAYLVV